MIKNCSITIRFHGVVSLQGILCRNRVLAKTKGSLVKTEYFYVATELSRPGVFCHDKMFLFRDRVGNGGEALCRDIIFYVATGCGQMKRFCVAIEQFYVTT